MKRGTKLFLGMSAAAAAALGIVFIALRDDGSSAGVTLPPRPTGKPDPGTAEPELAPPVPDNAAVEPGWHTVGWYTYQGGSDHPFWIRVDAGPPTEAYAGLGTERDWRWSIIEGSYGADGSWVNGALIATGTREALLGSDIDPLFGLAGSHMDLTAQIMARAAADQIDAMFPEDA